MKTHMVQIVTKKDGGKPQLFTHYADAENNSEAWRNVRDAYYLRCIILDGFVTSDETKFVDKKVGA